MRQEPNAVWKFKAVKTKKNAETWVVSIPAAVARSWGLSKDSRDLLVSLQADGSLTIKTLQETQATQEQEEK